MNADAKLQFSIEPNPAAVAAAERATLLEDPGFGRVFTVDADGATLAEVWQRTR